LHKYLLVMIDYLDIARQNELVFRAILESKGWDHKGMSLENVYEKYSKGRRSGFLTILNFEKKGNDDFEFTWEDIALLGGIGRCELWSFANGELKYIKAIQVWMS
jgi:hypothetical protein